MLASVMAADIDLLQKALRWKSFWRVVIESAPALLFRELDPEQKCE